MKPAIGHIVSYYQGDFEAPSGFGGPGWRGTNGTRWHPAIITHVHTDDCVNLVIFFDGKGAEPRTSMCRLPDEVFADGMHCTNSGWTWPHPA